jgi:hypothetical protein
VAGVDLGDAEQRDEPGAVVGGRSAGVERGADLPRVDGDGVGPEPQLGAVEVHEGADGSQWRDVPREFGAWSTVHNRFRRWRDAAAFDDQAPAVAGGAIGAALASTGRVTAVAPGLALKRPADGDDSGVGVEVSPLQLEGFALADAERQGEGEPYAVATLSRRGEDALGLVDGERFDFLFDQPGALARVAGFFTIWPRRRASLSAVRSVRCAW